MNVHQIVAPGDVVTDVTDRVRQPDDWELTTQAEGGAVGSGRVTLDDPDADLTVDIVRGLNAYRVTETLSEDEDPTVFAGHMADREITRGPYASGVSRNWDVSVTDANSILSRYLVLPTEGGKRTASTDEATIEWLITLSGFGQAGISDFSHLDFTDPVNMSETDWTGRTYLDVLDACARQSGKNYFIWWNGVDEVYALVYIPEDSEDLTTDIRLVDELSLLTEADDDTFAYSRDTRLRFDPSRVASRVVARGQDIEWWEANATTETEFSRRDVQMDEPDVTSLSVLRARARRYVASLSTEEETISGTVELPASKVSQFRAGHRLQVMGQHFDGYEDFVWMRLTEVTPSLLNPFVYSVRFTATRPTIVPPPPPTFGILRGAGWPNDVDGIGDLVTWAHTGDNPGAGYTVLPTTGPIEALQDTDPEAAFRPYYGWKATDTITDATVTLFVSVIGVRDNTVSFTVEWSILKNGVSIASEVVSFPFISDHGVSGWSSEGVLVTATGVDLVADDEIVATLVCSPQFIWQVPAGVGNFAERLEISAS